MTRFLLVAFLAVQCSSSQQTGTPKLNVSEAHYTKFSTGAKGDRGVIFRFVVEKPSGEVEFTRFTVNQQFLEPTIADVGEDALTFEVTKIYPGDRPIDPLPPGEPGNPLFFEENFKAWLFWEKIGVRDSLHIENWEEIKPEKLPN